MAEPGNSASDGDYAGSLRSMNQCGTPVWGFEPCFDEVASRMHAAKSLLVAIDFDGTLAPLAARPEDVVLAPQVRETLRSLVHVPHVKVAIVSGRSLHDVRGRVNVPEACYAGNHGLEISVPGFTFIEPMARALTGKLREICAELTAAVASIEGAWVEEKGLAASVHFRAVPAPFVPQVRRAVDEVLQRSATHFRRGDGHAVFEIRPRLKWGKGYAIHWIKASLGMVRAPIVFIGDDTTDEEAFCDLPNEVTVRVGKSSMTAARYRLFDPCEVHFLLRKMAFELRPGANRGTGQSAT